MATTFGTIQDEVQVKVEDASFQDSGSNVAYILQYANDAQERLARELVIPGHLKDSTVTTTTTDYKYNLPSDFFKWIQRRSGVYVGSNPVMQQIDWKQLRELDPSASTTTTATTGPSYYAILGSSIGIYPKWAGTLNIMDYQRIPTAMTTTASTLDIITDGVSGDRLAVEAIVAYCCAVIYSEEWLDEVELAQYHYEKWRLRIDELQRHITYNQDHRMLYPA